MQQGVKIFKIENRNFWQSYKSKKLKESKIYYLNGKNRKSKNNSSTNVNLSLSNEIKEH